jgi:hypothetical protein
MKFRPQHAPHSSRIGRQFIEWAKQYGHTPATGMVEFVEQQSQSRVREAHPVLPHDVKACAALRAELEIIASSGNADGRFLPVYQYRTAGGVDYRYTLMLAMALAEEGVEWTARVWKGMEYQGMLVGRGQVGGGRHNRMARLAIERALDMPLPNYVGA